MVVFPVLPSYYVFALGIFAAFPSRSKAFSQGSIGGLFYVNFMIDQFSYLSITSIGRSLVEDENDCGYACLEIPSCFSYNVAAFPDVNRKLLCELLPSDKYNNSDKFNASKEFHHFFIPSSCDSSPCKNTGKCIPLYQENGYTCICVEGFTGRNCKKNIDECKSSPCLNNGTCTDRINSFSCNCPPGFVGNRCESDINKCKSNPCLNNGTCTDRANGFNCSCPAGFAGKRCEIDVISNVVTQFLSPAIGNNSNWALCWQASTHGWAGTTFHNKCDGKRHTITIIKKDQYVFGGYTDIPWRICPDNWIHLQGSCYQFSSKSLSWTAAKSACEAKGSKLAMVTSQAEQQALVSKVSQNVWIGLRRDPKVHSRWLWVDGSRATYTHWNPGEPNDHGGNEDCTVMFPPAGKWNDGQCSSSLQHVCETNAFVDGYGTTSKSFIFSLLDKEGLAPFKSMVTNKSFAIYRGSSYGPTFGREYDVYIADNANQNANSYTNFGTSYSLPNGVTNSSTILAGTRYFLPDEVEVFYLA